jgi:chaperonin GroES
MPRTEFWSMREDGSTAFASFAMAIQFPSPCDGHVFESASRIAREKCFQYRGSPMKFRPLQDRVVVRRIDEEEKTAGGIIIPDTAKEKPMQGEVIAVGPGVRDEGGKLVPLDVKVGDRVLFGKWSGTEVKIDGEELAIMKESDIFGIIK